MSELESITAELRELMGGVEPRVDEDGVVTAKYVTPEAWGEFERLCDAIDAVHAQLERENAELRERVAVLDNERGNMHIGGSITDELREWVRDGKGSLLAIADRIDAEHAQLERDYKVACEVNERQDEQYADMVHKLDRAYEKNRNQRRQLTEVQEALHRRNEGDLKVRWQKELDRLERENEELRRQLESLMFDSRPMTDKSMAEHGWVRKDKEHIISHATIEVTPHIDWSRMADELNEFVEIVRGIAGGAK